MEAVPVAAAEQLSTTQLTDAMRDVMGTPPPGAAAAETGGGVGGFVSTERVVNGSLRDLYNGLDRIIITTDQQIAREPGFRTGPEMVAQSKMRETAVYKVLAQANDQEKQEIMDAVANPNSVYRRKWASSDFKLSPADYDEYRRISKQMRDFKGKAEGSVFTAGDFIRSQKDEWGQYLHKPEDPSVFVDQAAEIQKLRGIVSAKGSTPEQVAGAKQRIVDLTAASNVDSIGLLFQIQGAKEVQGAEFNLAKYADLKAKSAKMQLKPDENITLTDYESFLNGLPGFLENRNLLLALLTGGYRDKNQFPDLTTTDINALNYIRAMTENVVKAAGGDLGRGTVATRVEARPAVGVVGAVPVAEVSAAMMQGEEIPPAAYIKTDKGNLDWATFQTRMLAAAEKARTAGTMSEEQIQSVIADKMARFRAEMKTV
jgi:hypothetical protein